MPSQSQQKGCGFATLAVYLNLKLNRYSAFSWKVLTVRFLGGCGSKARSCSRQRDADNTHFEFGTDITPFSRFYFSLTIELYCKYVNFLRLLRKIQVRSYC